MGIATFGNSTASGILDATASGLIIRGKVEETTSGSNVDFSANTQSSEFHVNATADINVKIPTILAGRSVVVSNTGSTNEITVTSDSPLVGDVSVPAETAKRFTAGSSSWIPSGGGGGGSAGGVLAYLQDQAVTNVSALTAGGLIHEFDNIPANYKWEYSAILSYEGGANAENNFRFVDQTNTVIPQTKTTYTQRAGNTSSGGGDVQNNKSVFGLSFMFSTNGTGITKVRLEAANSWTALTIQSGSTFTLKQYADAVATTISGVTTDKPT